MNFTEEEWKLIGQFQRLPIGFRKRLNLWAVEIVPPVLFIGIGVYTGRSTYFIGAICVLMLLNIVRLWRQNHTVRVLKSIALKLGDHAPTQTAINET